MATRTSVFQPLPERYSFPEAEVEICRFWRERDIFHKSLELREGSPTFVFYEGPPTANGKPHPGHVLTRVMKDVFPRYKTMRGFRVPRKAGWDTHGLPVEIEVEKELGISGKEGIEQYGVEKFTRRCIESVFRYTREWEELTERIGFWVDVSDAYVTFHKSYVESVWWSLKTLFERGLLYEDRKIVWWWAQGGTTLSAAEVGLGYRKVADPSVFVRFRSAEDPRLSYLAWTTTPWTLPSNVALAVSPDAPYVRVEVPGEDGGSEILVMAAELVEKVLAKKVEPVSVSDAFPGTDLVGKRYQQLLPYREPEGGESFVIIAADFVTVDPSADEGVGTGIVHIAPAFGEDDYRVAKEEGLGFLQLVDDQGRMTAEVTEVAGVFCKQADRALIRRLRSDGLLFREEVYNHDYPFCWRSDDDPLIQYARPAWFVATSRFRDALLENNRAVNWVPEHIRDGRFGKFLEGNVDWALSRERFWGTPLPIWRCEKTGHMEAIGSYDELVSKPDVRGTEVFDEAKKKSPELSEHLRVHKPYIDAVTYRSPKDADARMRRVTEVIDCWYDAGAMPFAQWGYPHLPGSEEAFEQAFPADFISEAIDQTRGWFYTLLAESTLLQEEALPHPYRTCIVLGHVCDDKGEKMSKSKRNYLDPMEVVSAHGADALRWYFLAQGNPWTNVRFSLDRVGEAKKDFLIRLQNVWSFFVIYAGIDGFDPTAGIAAATSVDPGSLAGATGYTPVAERSLMDRWAISELHRTASGVAEALDRYDVLGGARALFDYVDGLSNWYVRVGRNRFWASGLERDKRDAYWTLYECLVNLARLAAPFVPFFAEELYRNLVAGPFGDSQPESVHLTSFPEPDRALIDEDLARRMALALEIVSLGRSARVQAQIRVRQPLAEAILVLADPDMEPGLEELLQLVQKELNVETISFARDADRFVEYELKPNFKLIGPRLGRKVQALKKVLAEADAPALRASIDETGVATVEVEDETVELSREEIEVRLQPREGYAAGAGRGVVLVLETEVTDELLEKWYARELVAKVNSLRGDRSLAYESRIRLGVWCGDVLRAAFEKHAESIRAETLAVSIERLPLDAEGGAAEGKAGDHAFRIDLEEV